MSARTFWLSTAAAVLAGGLLAAVCYWWVDRPVAFFVHRHRFFSDTWLEWPPVLSERLKYAAAAATLGVFVWRACQRAGRTQTVLLAIGVDLILATLVKTLLKFSFGRYWPETWKLYNPSLIANRAYGFNPFTFGGAYESFPSGHALVICSVLAVLWVSRPRWRWACVLLSALLCLTLVGMNYHFVSDVIAGADLGWIVGFLVARWFGLRPAAGGSW